MAQEYDFSLLLASQYSGGPLVWNDQILLNANGAVLNEIDVTRDKSRSFKVAKSEVISIALSPCRKFLAIIEGTDICTYIVLKLMNAPTFARKSDPLKKVVK